jgi:hypothetical protein
LGAQPAQQVHRSRRLKAQRLLAGRESAGITDVVLARACDRMIYPCIASDCFRHEPAAMKSSRLAIFPR